MKEYFGIGSIKNLENILHKNKVKNIFLVTGKKSYESSGVKEKLDILLKDYNVTYFSDFETNPKIRDVEKGISLLKAKDYDIVIAIGGGSVIDMGKLINIFSAQKNGIIRYIKKEKAIENKGKPLVAIPTTAGSGSEATHFAVVYVKKIKYSVANKHILPDYYIIDPQFTMNLPPYATASTGMDALCQAIESYWGVDSTRESKIYAKKAIKIIMKNIHEAVNNPSKNSRVAMSKAANLAGKAINITKTTAPHAISYPITSYFGVPHGHAVALTLGSMLIFNNQVAKDDVLDKRGVKYVRKEIQKIVNVLGASNSYQAKERIDQLMHNIGLKTRLSELGINYDNLGIIIKNVNLERIKNNPRQVTEHCLRGILKGLL